MKIEEFDLGSIAGPGIPEGGLDGQVLAKDGSEDYRSKWINPPSGGVNILDNWYFVNPINQRRVSGTVSEVGYFIDRWKLTSGEVTLQDEGILLNGTIIQILENALPNQQVSASYLTDSGVKEALYDNDTKTFTISSDGELIYAAKLELGNTSTLGRKENGEWVLNNTPPNPADMLARCQRYYYRLYASGGYSIICTVYSYNRTRLQGSMSLPVPLRDKPSFSYGGPFTIYYNGGHKAVQTLLPVTLSNSMGFTSFPIEANLEEGLDILVGALEGMTGSYIELDANL